jgi:hypothetical protein
MSSFIEIERQVREKRLKNSIYKTREVIEKKNRVKNIPRD